jgi:hypothetical protein
MHLEETAVMEDTAVVDLLAKAHFEIILADATCCRKEYDAAIERATRACAELEQRSVGLAMSDGETMKLSSLMARLRNKVRYLEAVQFLEAAA